MAERRRGARIARIVLSTTMFLLPAATLVPFGSVWLWEHGYLLYWAICVFVLTGIIFLIQWQLLRQPDREILQAEMGAAPNAAWTDKERAAWEAVEADLRDLTPDNAMGENAIRELAVRTIKIVAGKIHPSDADPVWNFTVPEALALAERVARRLRPVVIDTIPLGDQLTVKQALRLYEWRGAADWAERAYDIWRIVRLLNPATALANEARERVTKQLYTSLRDEFTVRLAQGYMREVARAAIDLYGGRLRIDNAEPQREHQLEISDNSPEASKFRWTRLARQAGNIGSLAAKSLWRRK